MTTFLLGVGVGTLVVLAAGWWRHRRRSKRLVELVSMVAAEPSSTHEWDDPVGQAVAKAIAKLDDARRTELEVANSELRLREQALSGLEEGVVLLGDAASVVYANSAAFHILGNALGGDTLKHTVLTSMARRAATMGVQESAFEDPISNRWFHALARMVEGTNHAVVVVRDETEARRLTAIRRDFVADASHELKTPVAAIQASIETVMLALMDGDVDAAAQFAGTVRSSSERLSALVSDLLDLSRLETASEQEEIVDLTRIVFAEVERHADAEPIPDLQAGDRSFEVRGSGADLALAVRNLVSNAVRYTPADGSVTVRLIPEDGWVTVEVADTGSGIPSKDLPRIFERFYRVDPARSRATGGTGLGLSIVRHVAQLHGGSVSAASLLGEGSTFRMRLPLVRVTV